MLPEEKNYLKHKNLFTVLAIFILLITITGISVAAYTWNYTSTHANTIGTGNISLSILESDNSINLKSFSRLDDSQGIALDSEYYYDFAVSTSATGAPGNINYKIIIKKEDAGAGYVQLPDTAIKIYLTKFDQNGEVEVMAPTLVSDIIGSGSEGALKFNQDKRSYLVHSHNSNKDSKTTKYRLRMWISKQNYQNNMELDTKYAYKLKVAVTGDLIQ